MATNSLHKNAVLDCHLIWFACRPRCVRYQRLQEKRNGASTYFDQVQQLYIAYSGRPADPDRLTFWATQVDVANGNMAEMIAGFASSSESNALYAGVSTEQKITAIYVNLFNRQPEPAGRAY